VEHNVAVIVAVIFQNISKNKSSRKKTNHSEKKEQGASPAPKIVSTLFPRKI